MSTSAQPEPGPANRAGACLVALCIVLVLAVAGLVVTGAMLWSSVRERAAQETAEVPSATAAPATTTSPPATRAPAAETTAETAAESATPAPQTPSSPTATPAADEETTAAPEEETTPLPEGTVDFEVTGSDSARSLDLGFGPYSSENGTLVVVWADMTNEADAPLEPGADQFFAYDSAGNRHSLAVLSYSTGEEGFAPGVTVELRLVFDVAEDVEITEVAFVHPTLTDGEEQRAAVP
ncbi:hypothetical protein [Brachybacterium hainanense]|uniref:DUF5067 domain-containing protein n=1 Tax=Brachybacterium hainanense TaxID=1541174 RepID=A0ABV6R8M0_9MICO